MNRREACTAMAGFLGLAGIKGEPLEAKPEPLAFVVSCLPGYDFEDVTDEQIARIQAKWEALFKGNPPMPIVILAPGMKYEVIRRPEQT